MSNPTKQEDRDRTTEALEWLGRELRYESFLAAVQAGNARVTPLSGRASRAGRTSPAGPATPADTADTTDDARHTAAA